MDLKVPFGVACLSAAAALSAPSAFAAAYVWNTTAANWNSAASWLPATGYPDSTQSGTTAGFTTDTATFAGSTAETAFLNPATAGNFTIATGVTFTGQEAASVTFSNTGTTTILGGPSIPAANSLALSSGLTISAGAGVVTIGDTTANATDTVGVIITGAQTFTNNSSNALLIDNGLSLSNNNNAARALTLAGTGSFTISGVIANSTTSGGNLSLAMTGTGILTLNGVNTYTGGTTVTAGTLKVAASGSLASGVTSTGAAVDLAGTIAAGTGTTTVQGLIGLGVFTPGTFTLESSGSITSTGVTTITGSTATIMGAISGGATTVTSSILNLDYSGLNNSHLTDTGVLTLSGATINLLNGSHNELVGSTTFGSSSLQGNTVITQSGGTSTLALQLITRNTGNTLDLQTASIANTTTVNVTNEGILGSYAVVGTGVGNVNFAVGATTTGTVTPITAYSGYTSSTTLPAMATGALTTTGNYLASGSTMLTETAAQTIYTLKIDSAVGSAQTFTLSGSGTFNTPQLTLNGSGLLYDGSDAYTITGGTLRSNAGTGELIINQYGTGSLTISSILSSGAVTKTGPGTLVLAGANTYSGVTYLNQGTIAVSSGATTPFGSGAIINFASGTTLDLSAAPSSLSISVLNSETPLSTGSLILGSSTGGTTTLTLGTGSTAGTFNGVISGTGSLVKNSANTQTLAGANTYTGTTTLNSGILNAGLLVNGGLASGIGTSSNAAANLVFNGGALQYSGTVAPASTDRLFTVGLTGATLDSSSSTAADTLTFSNSGQIVLSGTGRTSWASRVRTRA